MKIAIADEQSHIRSALCLLISEKTEHCVVLEIKRITNLLERLSASPVDMLIADWSFIASDAPTAIKAIRDTSSVKHIVIISSDPSVQQVAIDAGANGFVSKSDVPETVLMLIRQFNGDEQTTS